MKNHLLSTCLLLLLIATFTPNTAHAKTRSDRIRPTWITNTPKSPNNNYTFKVVMVDNGESLADSRTLALAELSRHMSKDYNISIDGQLSNVSTLHTAATNSSHDNMETFVLNINTSEEEVAIHAQKVDEYYEVESIGGTKIFRLYTLYAVSNRGKNPIFDNFNITDKYGARGLWRSAICPGWGQMYKKETAKGIVILVAEVAAIGGIIFTENERAAYISKIYSQPHFAQTYKTRADNYAIARNCCIGAAAAIYIYNLIDAIVAPGAKRVTVEKSRFQITATASDNFSGISMSYTF